MPRHNGEECQGCIELRARIDKLEKKVNAAIAGTVPVQRCECGRALTRIATMTHPWGGVTMHNVCDSCSPKIPYFDPENAKISFNDLPDANIGRLINSAFDQV